MVTEDRLPTKPLECWAKMKELRRKHFRHTWEAKDRGDVVIMGIVQYLLSIFAGLGNYANPSFGPYFTTLMRNPDELVKCLESVEARGFKKDICAAMRCHLGQLYAGQSTHNPLGGECKPDFIFQVDACPLMGKTGQLAGDILGVPYFVIDFPHSGSQQARQYLLDQMQEAISWMEKVTGREYNDELLIQAMKNEWRSMTLWAEVCMQVQHVPAPIDWRHLWSLRLPLVTMRHTEEVVDYVQMVLDEVKDRAKQGISARGFERARFTSEGLPPFFYPQILHHPEKYGAIYVIGGFGVTEWGAWDMAKDGTWTPAKPHWERGIEVRTREGALRTLVDLYVDHTNFQRTWTLQFRPQEAVKRTQDWHCAGAVAINDLGCKGAQVGVGEILNALGDAGIPTVVFDSSQTNPRDFDLAQVTDRVDTFFENLGLTRLEDGEAIPEPSGDAD